MAKDYFSEVSDGYSKFRPMYPPEMISYVASFAPEKSAALDVATGNGQVAVLLSDIFENVFATDISASQLDHAPKRNNLVYSVESAEATSFRDDQFDLVSVAQAIHWFDFDKFYDEMRRILKPNGILAVIGYGLFSAGDKADRVIWRLYDEILGSFWHPERLYIDENYQTIPFPFEEIQAQKFSSEIIWTFEQLVGYLSTWSAVQQYKKQHGSDPLLLVYDELRSVWQENQKITLPFLLRIGINK